MVNTSKPKVVGVIELPYLDESPIYWVWELAVNQLNRFVILRCDIPLDEEGLTTMTTMTDQEVIEYIKKTPRAFYYPGNPL